jgi:hypothetical protein
VLYKPVEAPRQQSPGERSRTHALSSFFNVSRELGHADISTSANVHAYFTEAMADRMADRMAGILGAATPT